VRPLLERAGEPLPRRFILSLPRSRVFQGRRGPSTASEGPRLREAGRLRGLVPPPLSPSRTRWKLSRGMTHNNGEWYTCWPVATMIMRRLRLARPHERSFPPAPSPSSPLGRNGASPDRPRGTVAEPNGEISRRSWRRAIVIALLIGRRNPKCGLNGKISLPRARVTFD